MAEPKPVFIKEDQDALRHYVMGQASASLNPEEAIKIYKMSFDSVRLQAELSPPHPSDIIFFEGLANDVYDKLSLDNPESCCAAKDLLDSVDECYYLSKKNDLNLFGLALFPSMDVSDAEIALYKKQNRLFHKLVKHGTFETLSHARNMLLDFYQKNPYQGFEADDIDS
ncbi:MAG TPA: hypothetical protein VGF14_07280, partial [Alphaproteobacteria bacterium]